MGVVSLLVLLATAAATAVGGRAAAVATVRINVAADLGNQSIVDQVTLLTTRKAAVYSIRSIGGACMDKAHLAETKGVGVIYITNDMKCDNTVANKNRLVLIYDSSNDTFVTNAGVKFNSSDTAAFNAQLVDLVQRVAKDNKTLVNPVPSGVMVPIWAVICVGTIVGALMAGNCIFFNKIRGMKMKTHPEKKSSPSSSSEKSEGSKRGSSSRKQKGSSRSSKSTSTRSEKKKNSSKRGKTTSIECRSSKSLSTKKCGNERPTSVKVIPVGPPAKKEEPKDEVAIVMAKQGSASLPERSMDRRIEMPMTEDEFILAMKKVLEFVTDFYRNPSKYPVSTAIHPNDIINKLPDRAPENPEAFENVWKDFNEIILKGFVQWQHPQFHAFFPCGRSYPDILAETLISSLGTVGFTWSANPAITELDNAMVNWMGRALGIPESFLFRGNDMCASDGGGVIADTSSDAIFCAMMAARHIKVEEELVKAGKIEEDKPMTESNRHTSKKYEKRAQIISKFVAYGSYESHSSFEKACKMACVRCRPIKIYEKDDWGMRREEVEKEMEKDRQRGLIPFYLHVALGTTSTATSDHLSELTPLKEKYGVWIHVDAAYAGNAWIVEKYRKNAGIEKVDSININLHKFFLTSTSVTLFWTRRQRDYKEFFRIDPAYLKKKSGANDLRDWGIQLSRRFKSLKVYMLLRMYGLSGMRAYVTRLIDMTDYMETLIVKLPSIRKFGKTHYGLFCVQYCEEGMTQAQVNQATNRFCEFINNSHKMVITHSNVRGHDILRLCVTLERSTKKDIQDSVAIFTQLLEEFRKQKDASGSFQSVEVSRSQGNLMQDVDMGIVGSPNPTLSKTPTNVKSTISCESLVGPRTAASLVSVATTCGTQGSTQAPTAPSPVPSTNISAVNTEVLSPPTLATAAPATPVPTVPTVTPPVAPPVANKMPPLTPAFVDPSTKSGRTSSYNAPASAPPVVPAVQAPATPGKQQTVSTPEVTARSDTITEKK